MKLVAIVVGHVRHNLELLVWTGALIALYFIPTGTGHFSLCPLNAVGVGSCPGCGIGHAIHHILHLEFSKAWQDHYLGVFAVFIIVYRIFQLLKTNFQNQLINGQPNL